MTDGRDVVAAGGCQCGAVRYAFYAPLEKSHVCHCRMCQRATGGLFAALVGAKREDFAWVRGEARIFASSNLAERGFCGECGTPLSFTYLSPGSNLYVTIGSLDAPESAPIEIQFGIESRLPWVRFCENVPSERTGETPAAQDFLARMKSNQDRLKG